MYKTWAPRGQTPLLYHRLRRDRISVISGISVSPRRRRLGLYYRLHAKNIKHPEVCDFVRHLLRHLRGPVVLLWDGGPIHKGEAIRSLLVSDRMEPVFDRAGQGLIIYRLGRQADPEPLE